MGHEFVNRILFIDIPNHDTLIVRTTCH